MEEAPSYKYYKTTDTGMSDIRRHRDGAKLLGEERYNPHLSNPDYLIYRERKKIFSNWLSNYITGNDLYVLDVGGRIQPYRKLIDTQTRLYVAIDPQFEGLLDVIGIGETLPFPDQKFDVVICTQVLNYVKNPTAVVAEIHRVLKPGAYLFLSVPALFPRHHDERWRFLPDGLKTLLSDFSDVIIEPEGHSYAGLFRTLNVCMNIYVEKELFRRVLRKTLIPFTNIAGKNLDKFSHGNDKLTTNYSVLARK